MSRPGRLVPILVVAVALAALSVRIERVGPELAETGNLCGPRMDEICRAPRLNGGFPLAYLFDVPTVSVPDQLGLGEDDFRVVPFAADVLCYALLLQLGARLVARRRVARRGEDGMIPDGSHATPAPAARSSAEWRYLVLLCSSKNSMDEEPTG